MDDDVDDDVDDAVDKTVVGAGADDGQHMLGLLLENGGKKDV